MTATISADTTVFLVDDDDAVRDSLATLLESEGHAVEPFPSALAFLDAIDPRRRGCLLVDVRMPGMGGLELQETLNAQGVSLPVIVMTGHADVPLAVRAMKAGALDFLEKPFADESLLASIRAALAEDAARREANKPQASAETLERLAQLTPRERDVLEGLVAGHPNKVIAHMLTISPRTVEIHRARVMEKMQAKSLSHLVRMAIEAGVEPREA